MTEPDKLIKGKGFTVEIAGHGFVPVEVRRGGRPLVEAHSNHGDATTAQSTISELELVAFVTADQNHFVDIAKKVAAEGEPYRVNITVTEYKGKKPTKTYNYFDCLITSYDYAKLSPGSGELMTETATFKPTRLEVS